MYLFEVGDKKKKKAVKAWVRSSHEFLRSKKIHLVSLSAYVILSVKNNKKKKEYIPRACEFLVNSSIEMWLLFSILLKYKNQYP